MRDAGYEHMIGRDGGGIAFHSHGQLRSDVRFTPAPPAERVNGHGPAVDREPVGTRG